jgi:predicted branched-subunit amino acid permease
LFFFFFLYLLFPYPHRYIEEQQSQLQAKEALVQTQEYAELSPHMMCADQPSTQRRHAFLAGIKAVAPVALGVVPFGLVAGAAAVSKGMTGLEGQAFSVLIFAGAAHLAALELLSQHAPLFVILLTGWLINLRMMIYSAAIAPYFKGASLGTKVLASYLLTDQAFVVTRAAHDKAGTMRHVISFYFGTACTLWIVWQSTTFIGMMIGLDVPPGWHLDFAVPLAFLALLVPTIKDSAGFWAALSAGFTVWLLAGLPMNLGFVIAVPVGMMTGVLVERMETKAGAAA